MVLNDKRLIIFKDDLAETKGFKILYAARMPFSYRDDEKYVVTKKQCAMLKAQHVSFNIQKYL